MDLGDINTQIATWINNGIYNMSFNLINYNTLPFAQILLPPELISIKFIGNSNIYNFSIIVDPANARTQNLNIQFQNVNANSGNLIFLNLAGNNNSSYNTVINYSGVNQLVSNGDIGVCVCNGRTVEFTGEQNGVLNITGGNNSIQAYPAIGNSSQIYTGGGRIIFSGQGTVNAYGGSTTIFGMGSAFDGSFAIGFNALTMDSNSIIITGMAKVNAYGGNGQSMTDNLQQFAFSSGNGGAGISLGSNGSLLIQSYCCNLISLNAVGGNGGLINADCYQADILFGGNGGNGIEISSGIIQLCAGANIIGGNGYGICEEDCRENLNPIKGGSGGCAIYFRSNSIGLNGQGNLVELGRGVCCTGGNGGNSGVLADYCNQAVIGLGGGCGGDIIRTNNIVTNIILCNLKCRSGNGGNGGSTCVYYDCIFYVKGTDMPGCGGNSGELICGEYAFVSYLCPIKYKCGRCGKGGVGKKKNGRLVFGRKGCEN